MSPTVLCIDDQVTGLQVRKFFLESLGYAVLSASSGREGLQMLNSQPVDAVILDYRMPEMDGARVADEIRKIHPHLPIILLSGYIAELPTTLRENVNSFVAKGSPPEALLRALDEVLGRRPTRNFARVTGVLDEIRRQAVRAREHLGKSSAHLHQSRKLTRDNEELLRSLKHRKS